MKTITKHRAKLAWLTGLFALALIAVYLVLPAFAVTNPVMSVAATGTNQVTLTLSNATANAVYEIQWTEYLDYRTDWQLVAVGASNQITFTNIYPTKHGFFRAMQDTNALPFTLTVTIVSPANGTMVQ